MFPAMRRSRQALAYAACEEILSRGTHGVLSLTGVDGWPYGVPMSYVWQGGALYLHSARTGHKITALARERRVSFCVVDRDSPAPEEYTTYFRSVILFGRAELLSEPEEITAALTALGQKYHPGGDPARLSAVLKREGPAAGVIKITPEHISGKQAIELC